MEAIRRILVPVDFSECSRRALAYAGSLGERLGATLDLLHVWEPVVYALPDVMVYSTEGKQGTLSELARAHAESEMKRLLDELELEGRVCHQRTIESDDTAATICQVAQEEGYDLIVMGTHGRRGVSEWIQGSVAGDVVRKAPCPVITLR